ncbi:unnamed protein product, partial [Durusdinium trenchii]
MVVIAPLVHGAEIYGMNATRTQKAEVRVNTALRTIFGVKTSSAASVTAMEAGIPALAASAAGARARAPRKASLTATHLSTLAEMPN